MKGIPNIAETNTARLRAEHERQQRQQRSQQHRGFGFEEEEFFIDSFSKWIDTFVFTQK